MAQVDGADRYPELARRLLAAERQLAVVMARRQFHQSTLSLATTYHLFSRFSLRSSVSISEPAAIQNLSRALSDINTSNLGYEAITFVHAIGIQITLVHV